LEQGVKKLREAPGVEFLAASGWHRTLPAGGPPGQEWFLNGAALLRTSLAPESLLVLLKRIEGELGRTTRAEHWGPRPIDLDLLLYEDEVLQTTSLVLPHPRMAWRRFVLEPAAEIAGEMVHPTTGWSIGRLLDHLNTTPYYLAVAGAIGVGKTRLAKTLAERFGARWIREELDSPGLEAFYHDPAGKAWAMEIEFLDQRVRLLSADGVWGADPPTLSVSDFWFEQSPAFAGVWLAPERRDAFLARCQEARRHVVRPRLVVLLDAPPDELERRVRQRGRTCEESLRAEQLERIRQAMISRAAMPDQGPVLRLSNRDADDFESVVGEVRGAIEAMR
jgi:2-amino-4-hydroxy-6-hydroxymethyldihydropteridine diphosphokinase